MLMYVVRISWTEVQWFNYFLQIRLQLRLQLAQSRWNASQFFNVATQISKENASIISGDQPHLSGFIQLGMGPKEMQKFAHLRLDQSFGGAGRACPVCVCTALMNRHKSAEGGRQKGSKGFCSFYFDWFFFSLSERWSKREESTEV